MLRARERQPAESKRAIIGQVRRIAGGDALGGPVIACKGVAHVERLLERLPPHLPCGALRVGDAGAGGLIPGGATLIFDTEVMGIN